MKFHRTSIFSLYLRWIVGLWQCCCLCCVISVSWSGEVVVQRINYQAADQEVADLFAGLGAFSSEHFQPDVDLLVSGIGATRARFSLIQASSAACRQALAFSLDCWWAYESDGIIALLTSDNPPQGVVSVRTCTSTLRRQPAIPPLVDRLIAPWLDGKIGGKIRGKEDGKTGLSYLPEDATWAATLDDNGHQRLFELLRVCERLSARATTRIPDVDLPDLRRLILTEIAVHNWGALVEELAQSMQASVAIAPLLQLQKFPLGGVRIRQQKLDQIISTLREYGIVSRWSHGVLCLSENDRQPARFDREHPAQRRQLACIPIGHLLSQALDGEVLATMIRRYVTPSSWDLPGAGLELLDQNRVLLVAGDIDAQHAVLDAINTIDRLGMELWLSSLTALPDVPSAPALPSVPAVPAK